MEGYTRTWAEPVTGTQPPSINLSYPTSMLKTINCLVYRSYDNFNVFDINISTQDNVSSLAKLLKQNYPKHFVDIEAYEIKLYDVLLPLDKSLESRVRQLDLGQRELLVHAKKLSSALPDIRENCVHVIATASSGLEPIKRPSTSTPTTESSQVRHDSSPAPDVEPGRSDPLTHGNISSGRRTAMQKGEIPIIISQSTPVPAKTPGKADIIGFGYDGVYVLRNGVARVDKLPVKGFGRDDGTWSTEQHVRLLADTTGNGHKDIIGFAHKGVWVCENLGDGTFETPRVVSSAYGYEKPNGCWRVDRHIRYMADIRNIGCADIVGFGDTGVTVSQNKNTGERAEFLRSYCAVEDFGWNQGWRIQRHLRFLADTTGDGFLDIVGFGNSDVYIGRSNGHGTWQVAKPTGLRDFCYHSGWRVDEHPRFLADLTGDGTVDIVGFKGPGAFVSLNDGKGNFQPSTCVLHDLSDGNGGWKADKHPRFVTPLTGSRTADIIGFGDAGVYVSEGKGDGTFHQARRVLDDFGYNHGWRVDKHPRFVVDMNGNGCADIVAFGNDAVWVSYNRGNGTFTPKVRLTGNFCLSLGWNIKDTVRYVTNLDS